MVKQGKDDNEEALKEVFVNKNSKYESKITTNQDISKHCSNKCKIGHRKNGARKVETQFNASRPIERQSDVSKYLTSRLVETQSPASESVETRPTSMTIQLSTCVSIVSIRIQQHQEKHADIHIHFPSDTLAENDTKVSDTVQEKLKECDTSPDIVTEIRDTALDPLAVQNAAVEDNVTVECGLYQTNHTVKRQC